MDPRPNQLRLLQLHIRILSEAAGDAPDPLQLQRRAKGWVDGFACAVDMPIDELIRIAKDEPPPPDAPVVHPNDTGAFILGSAGRSTLRLLADALHLSEPQALDLALRDTYRRLLEQTQGPTVAADYIATFGYVQRDDLAIPAGTFPCGCSLEKVEAGHCGQYDKDQLERPKPGDCKADR